MWVVDRPIITSMARYMKANRVRRISQSNKHHRNTATNTQPKYIVTRCIKVFVGILKSIKNLFTAHTKR